MIQPRSDYPIALSIGILAHNEEGGIGAMLKSLFAQTIFSTLALRQQRCEIICLSNGCTDRTSAVAGEIFAQMEKEHPNRHGLSAWVADIPEPGRNNAWNWFVHEFSAKEARFLCVMDADIIFNKPNTLELVLTELERNPHLGGASDWPVKDILFKQGRKSLREQLSLATSDMTGTIAGRLNGMLYCLRSEVARNLYLPRDVVANDDGFFKAAICTNFFREPVDPTRVVSVRQATHLYEPYLAINDVIKNQKRQMIGQTTVYVIVEHLKTLPLEERAQLGATLRRLESTDPDWLKRLIEAHIAGVKHFWQLFPDVLSFRWKRYRELGGIRLITHFPAALAGSVVTAVASWQALKFLRKGVSTYWPKAQRQALLSSPQLSSAK